MSNIRIRKIKEEDVLAVANLEAGCFIDPWPEKQIRYEMKENPCAKVYVALLEDEVVGYLDFMITFDSATINRICVNESYRRKGIAQALLNKMVEVCKKQKDRVDFITLEVRSSNEKAISLYRKNGWEEIVKKPHYYEDGEDAIYMVRSL